MNPQNDTFLMQGRMPCHQEIVVLSALEKMMVVESVAGFPNADECRKLLDNGWGVWLFCNELGSYTAVACKESEALEAAMDNDAQITDDITPSKALHRLTEKLVFGRIVDGSTQS